jgi:hypothetical protein
MRLTLSVTPIPASNQTLVLVGIFLNPCMFGAGGFTKPSIRHIPLQNQQGREPEEPEKPEVAAHAGSGWSF